MVNQEEVNFFQDKHRNKSAIERTKNTTCFKCENIGHKENKFKEDDEKFKKGISNLHFNELKEKGISYEYDNGRSMINLYRSLAGDIHNGMVLLKKGGQIKQVEPQLHLPWNLILFLPDY